jgi:hypothetical protein
VIDAADRVGDVSVLPWHGALREARSKYLRHSATWEDYFSDGAQDPETLFGTDPQINATFRIAMRSLLDAEAFTVGKSFGTRIDAIADD